MMNKNFVYKIVTELNILHKKSIYCFYINNKHNLLFCKSFCLIKGCYSFCHSKQLLWFSSICGGCIYYSSWCIKFLFINKKFSLCLKKLLNTRGSIDQMYTKNFTANFAYSLTFVPDFKFIRLFIRFKANRIISALAIVGHT